MAAFEPEPMPLIPLHLVDESGQPVPDEVREAVERAYRYLTFEYKRLDPSLLANIAEATALTICRNADEIGSIKPYAFGTAIGKVNDWLSTYDKEDPGKTSATLERAAGGVKDRSHSDVEYRVLFERMKAQLNARDQQILVLIAQGLDKPRAIAEALGLTYEAAKKALQQVKDRMKILLAEHEQNRKDSQNPPEGPDTIGPKRED